MAIVVPSPRLQPLISGEQAYLSSNQQSTTSGVSPGWPNTMLNEKNRPGSPFAVSPNWMWNQSAADTVHRSAQAELKSFATSPPAANCKSLIRMSHLSGRFHPLVVCAILPKPEPPRHTFRPPRLVSRQPSAVRRADARTTTPPTKYLSSEFGSP